MRRRHNGRHAQRADQETFPEHTHAVLRRRAAQASQSLQEYLLALLVAETAGSTVEEILDRADRGAVPLDQATVAIHTDRDRR